MLFLPPPVGGSQAVLCLLRVRPGVLAAGLLVDWGPSVVVRAEVVRAVLLAVLTRTGRSVLLGKFGTLFPLLRVIGCTTVFVLGAMRAMTAAGPGCGERGSGSRGDKGFHAAAEAAAGRV